MNVFEIDETHGLPVWIQLRNRFIYLIKSGYFKPGEQLPSVRNLAAELSINYNTVSKTYVDLEHSGYVISVRGRGVFVSKTIKADQDGMEEVDLLLEDCVRQCLSMGVPFGEINQRMQIIESKIKMEAQRRTDEKKGYA